MKVEHGASTFRARRGRMAGRRQGSLRVFQRDGLGPRCQRKKWWDRKLLGGRYGEPERRTQPLQRYWELRRGAVRPILKHLPPSVAGRPGLDFPQGWVKRRDI